jgi:protein ImuA
MNKKSSDSIRQHLPDAGWGHALAALGDAQAEQRSLADILAGLPVNACHEILGKDKGDAASLFGFGAMLAAMLSAARNDAPCFFVRPLRRGGGRLYPPGLAGLGIDPARCFSVHAPDLLAALKATADIARSGAAGAVLVEIEGNPRLLDLTASRRLALAAEKAGTAVLLLRMGAREAPGAAYSRWQVASASSFPDRLTAINGTSPLPHPTTQNSYPMGGRVGEWAGAVAMDAPGPPTFDIRLLRHRRMAAGQSAQLTWNLKEQKFDEQFATQSPQRGSAGETTFGRLFSLAARRAADPHTRRAA